MNRFKSIKLYFFSILNLFFLRLKNIYLQSNYYNKKISSFIPEKIFYNPSTYLSASLSTINNNFYKIANTSPDIFWRTEIKNKLEFENLHSFLWLSKLDRKNSKKITKKIIESWINIFFNYNPKTWDMQITAKRIIAWSSNTDITLENAEKLYKDKFFLSLTKQSSFLVKNLNNLFYEPNKIICCAAIILSGLIFKENNSHYKLGIKELEKTIKNCFDETGFPRSHNPEEVYIYIKYLILVREWLKEAQIGIPNFLNTIINKCGSCYAMLSCSNKQFPLFNGASEVNYKDYDIFLKSLKYKFINKNEKIGNLIKVKKKKFEFYIDCGNPPPNNFSKYYQAGCLSFELISNKQKIICNSGYRKYASDSVNLLSRTTAAHSTLYINDTSSCEFQKNSSILKVYGNSLVNKHKIINKSYVEDKNFYSIVGAHNGYEKKFGCIHTRLIKISKKEDIVLGTDEVKKNKNYLGPLIYFIRFHIYPGTKIVKTKGGNSILISLSNGGGWLLQSTTNDLKIEKSIFFANKNKIINNESVCISGAINEEIISIKWKIKRIS